MHRPHRRHRKIENAATCTNGWFGEAAPPHTNQAERQLRAEHVYHLDLVVVALRLAHPRPRAVWRCTIDGPLCGGLAGGARRAGLRQEALTRLRVSLL
jgi:hypothetical protein